jgi:hypothetical protein
MKILAKINPSRTLSIVEDTILLQWDDREFHLDYHTFLRLVRTLEQGKTCDYADCPGCAFVRVDRELHEVWIANECLTLHQREFRLLLNAALSTETRLHGVMKSTPDPLAEVTMRPVGAWRMPRALPRSAN